MDGNTLIGGITRHRANAYCRNCGHIQEIHWVETGCSIDDYRDIKCEICNHDNLLTARDLELELWMLKARDRILVSKDKIKKNLGDIAKIKSVLERLQ